MNQKHVNWLTFLPPAIALGCIIAVGALVPKALDNSMAALLDWVNHNCDWFYCLGMFLLMVFCLWAAFGKCGKIRLGGKDAKQEMSFWKWFCVVLTSGMAVGITYWCVAEPLSYFQDPPGYAGYEGGTIEAAEGALRYVLLHWTLIPFACFTAGAVVIAFLYWNCKKPFSISTGFYPLIGEKALGGSRYLVNALCIFCLCCGLGTTLGLAVDQMSVGLQYTMGLNISKDVLAFIVCVGFAAIGILVACSGLHKGVTYVSTANMYLFLFFLGFTLLFSGNLHTILGSIVTSTGKYLGFLIPEALNTEPYTQSGWVANQTVFYWGWWVAFGPMVGLFQVKLAKGRTVREYILVNMIVPGIFLTIWMCTFGSTAISYTLAGNTSITDAIASWGSSVAFFAFLKNLPLSVILIPVALITMIFSIVTQTEAEILTVADMCVATDEELAKSDNMAPAWIKVIWGLIMSFMAYILLYSGGLAAVQNISIIIGVLMLLILLVTCAGGIKAFRNYEEYDVILKEDEDY